MSRNRTIKEDEKKVNKDLPSVSDAAAAHEAGKQHGREWADQQQGIDARSLDLALSMTTSCATAINTIGRALEGPGRTQQRARYLRGTRCSDFRNFLSEWGRNSDFELLEIDLQRTVVPLCCNDQCCNPAHLTIMADGEESHTPTEPFDNGEVCGKPIMEFEDGGSVEMRLFMFTLFKVAEEEGRLANSEDMERRGTLVASCGNLHCINRDHVRIVLDSEVGD